jgi:hypothetical protein
MCNRCPLKCEVRRETDGRNTLQILQCKGVELENLEEAANNHQTILIYVPFLRQAYLCSEYEMTQSTVADQYTVDP